MAKQLNVLGGVALRSDTRRLLLSKQLKALGGTPLKTDTERILRAKIDKVMNGLGTTSAAI